MWFELKMHMRMQRMWLDVPESQWRKCQLSRDAGEVTATIYCGSAVRLADVSYEQTQDSTSPRIDQASRCCCGWRMALTPARLG
jgi:hypothetical protein